MRLPVSKLSHQIIALCVSLVVVTCGLVLVSFWWFSNRYVQEHVEGAVNNASQTFEQYYRSRTEQLISGAQALTTDPKFLAALNERNEALLLEKMHTQAARIDADIMFISGDDSTPDIRVRDGSLSYWDLSDLLGKLLPKPGVTVFIAERDHLFQMLSLPVPKGGEFVRLVCGFKIDSSDIQELKRLTRQDISFYVGDEVVLSSMSGNLRDAHQRIFGQTRFWLLLERPQYLSVRRAISAPVGEKLSVVISNDLTSIYRSFDRLVITSIAIAAMIIAFGVLAGIWMANTLTEPLARLAVRVNRIARGEFDSRIAETSGSREIRQLLHAFNNMGEEIKQRQAHILYQAKHDLLTGLLNRDSLLKEIDQAISQGQPFCLMAVYLRGLQGINDNLGFDAGDAFLREAAKRMKTHLPHNRAHHGRLEGNLFVSIVFTEHTRMGPTELGQVRQMLAVPVKFRGLLLQSSLNLGASRFPDNGENGKMLVRRTLIAVEHARRENLSVCFYKDGEDEAHMERLALVEDLKLALNSDDGQLYMNYQPKMQLATGRIEKLEALIRWVRPSSGFVPPDIFVDIAERAGLILELTAWVVNKVLSQQAQWRAEGVQVPVAINISAQDLLHPDFFRHLQASTQQYDVPPENITLELTERDLMSNEEQGVLLMQQLRDAGYTLSVDDYGIGQSSLSKLKQLPVHELKIDKSFILDLANSETDQIIVRSTIELGHNLGLKVVAEGVEDAVSQQLLVEMNCDYIQGYHLARPLPAEQVRPWLAEHDNR